MCNKLLIILKFFVIIFACVLVAVKYVHIGTVIIFDLFLMFMSIVQLTAYKVTSICKAKKINAY
jgi:hypothetical protein